VDANSRTDTVTYDGLTVTSRVDTTGKNQQKVEVRDELDNLVSVTDNADKIATCRLHDINPYTYLTDVLLRINVHPASQVADLTPRLWKDKFGGDPLRSDLWMRDNRSVE